MFAVYGKHFGDKRWWRKIAVCETYEEAKIIKEDLEDYDDIYYLDIYDIIEE